MIRSSRMFAVAFLAVSAALAAAQSSGVEIYKTNCTPCHGEAGDSNTPAGKLYKVPSFLTSDVFKKSDDEIMAFAQKGKGDMPAWSGVLSDEELKAVITYIRTFQKDVSRQANPSAQADSPRR